MRILPPQSAGQNTKVGAFDLPPSLCRHPYDAILMTPSLCRHPYAAIPMPRNFIQTLGLVGNQVIGPLMLRCVLMLNIDLVEGLAELKLIS